MKSAKFVALKKVPYSKLLCQFSLVKKLKLYQQWMYNLEIAIGKEKLKECLIIIRVNFEVY